MRLLGVLILCGWMSLGQAQSLKQCLKYGEESMRAGDYHQAITFYEKALNYDSASIDVLNKYAGALYAYNNYPKALYYYTKVANKGKGKIYPESIYYKALLQKNMGMYRESITTWKQVKKVLGRKSKSYYGLKSRQEMKACNWAYKSRKDSSDWEIKPADFNTEDSEFSPLMVGDEQYISSMKARETKAQVVLDEDYRIQIYKKEGSGFTALDSVINSVTGDNGEAVFSEDGKRLYFTRCVGEEPCQIYIARKNGDSWSNPDKLGVVNQKGKSSVQPFVFSNSGKEYLLFSSNRDGGQGGLDIWFSEVSNNGNQYSEPKNLGKIVNSPDDEISPYYNVIEKRLYFSSTWHYGYGGMDVFSSNGTLGGKFSKPRNLKKPVNSVANDIYYKKTDLFKAQLSSNRTGSLSQTHGNCCNDVYIVELPQDEPEKEEYKDLEDLNRHLPVTLYFHNDRPNPNTLDTFTTLNYLTTYNRYHDMIPEYKQKYSAGLKGQKAEDSRSDIEDFFFNKVDKGVEDLELFTRLLLVELEKGQKIEMTVQGYASPLAKTEYNVKLTYRRISSMINYLKEYDNGRLRPYIDGTSSDGGSLSFIQIPFGEYTADQTTSDNPNDQKNSVYSRKAAQERKIEIQSVQIKNESDSTYAEIHFDSEVYDFGVLNSLEKLEHTFTYTNTGKENLSVESVESECPCVTIDFEKTTLKPGEKASFKISFDPSQQKGKNMYPIKVTNNGFPKEKVLSVTADIL